MDERTAALVDKALSKMTDKHLVNSHEACFECIKNFPDGSVDEFRLMAALWWWEISRRSGPLN